MVAEHAFSASTQEAEAGGSLWVRSQRSLDSEFQESQHYTQKPWRQNQNQNWVCMCVYACVYYDTRV